MLRGTFPPSGHEHISRAVDIRWSEPGPPAEVTCTRSLFWCQVGPNEDPALFSSLVPPKNPNTAFFNFYPCIRLPNSKVVLASKLDSL